jgi:hypothetical protein
VTEPPPVPPRNDIIDTPAAKKQPKVRRTSSKRDFNDHYQNLRNRPTTPTQADVDQANMALYRAQLKSLKKQQQLEEERLMHQQTKTNFQQELDEMRERHQREIQNMTRNISNPPSIFFGTVATPVPTYPVGVTALGVAPVITPQNLPTALAVTDFGAPTNSFFLRPPAVDLWNNNLTVRESMLEELNWEPKASIEDAAKMLSKDDIIRLVALKTDLVNSYNQSSLKLQDPNVQAKLQSYHRFMNEIGTNKMKRLHYYGLLAHPDLEPLLGWSDPQIAAFVRTASPDTLARLDKLFVQNRPSELVDFIHKKTGTGPNPQLVKCHLRDASLLKDEAYCELVKVLAPFRIHHFNDELTILYPKYLDRLKKVLETPIKEGKVYKNIYFLPNVKKIFKVLSKIFSRLSSISPDGCFFPVTFYHLLKCYTEAKLLEKLGLLQSVDTVSYFENKIVNFLRTEKGDTLAEAWKRSPYAFGKLLEEHFHEAAIQSSIGSCYLPNEDTARSGTSIYLIINRRKDDENKIFLRLYTGGMLTLYPEDNLEKREELNNHGLYRSTLQLSPCEVDGFSQRVFELIRKLPPYSREQKEASTRYIIVNPHHLILPNVYPPDLKKDVTEIFIDFDRFVDRMKLLPGPSSSSSDNKRPIFSTSPSSSKKPRRRAVAPPPIEERMGDPLSSSKPIEGSQQIKFIWETFESWIPGRKIDESRHRSFDDKFMGLLNDFIIAAADSLHAIRENSKDAIKDTQYTVFTIKNHIELLSHHSITDPFFAIQRTVFEDLHAIYKRLVHFVSNASTPELVRLKEKLQRDTQINEKRFSTIVRMPN